MLWTAEQVIALAPDASSANSGKGLASARKWQSLGANEVCAWGTIQGSGKDPYRTSIDLATPAFKCSCPSRKFPCKHGLGLFLILTQQPGALTEKEPPAWTTEWLAKRAEKEEKKSPGPSPSEKPSDPEAAEKAAIAAAKRLASREAKVTAGLDELSVWLEDMVRSGFAALPGKPSGFWESPAARLVDAQAPGLARRISNLDGITSRSQNWPEHLLRTLAMLYLTKEAWSRIGNLPISTQADLRATIGFNISQEEVMAQAPIRDHWMVVGQRVEEDDRLRTQRTWLFGVSTGHPALCLSFSASPDQPLDVTLPPGWTVEADLVFFPGSWPLRALIKERHNTSGQITANWPHATIASANAFAAEALIANPWIQRLPFALNSVIPVQRPEGWIVRDDAGDALPLEITEAKAWIVYALSGGKPISLAGEWNGETFAPLSVLVERRFVCL